MATDPFRYIGNVTDDNFLDIRIESLLRGDFSETFKRSIDNLIKAKRTLTVINKVGRLNEVGTRIYYIQAIQWLHCETPITNLVSVPQIGSLQSIDEGVVATFELFTTNLLQTLRGDQIYAQVEIMTAVTAVTKSSRAAERESALLDNFEEEANSIVEAKRVELSTSSHDNLASLEQTRASIEQQLQTRQRQINEEMSGQLSEAINRFQQAQALEDWGKVYDADILEYEHRLFGRRMAEGTLLRNIATLRHKLLRSTQRKERFTTQGRKLMGLIFKNFLTLARTVSSRLASYSAKRTATFSLLLLFVLFITLLSFLPSIGITHIGHFKLPNMGDPSSVEWHLRLVIYLPPVILLGVAYSFAVKNYRIYSNMLDQYRHRRAVARTSQGVILSLRPEEDKDVRIQMTSAAALALFEMRNTGHLTKKEAESLSLIDLLKIGK